MDASTKLDAVLGGRPVAGALAVLALGSAATRSEAATGSPASSGPLAPASAFATYPRIAGVAAAGGWTAWSVERGPRWQLVLRSPSGRIARPAIAGRSIPFDASLGLERRGVVTLAYSRCARDPTYAPGGIELAWYTARGCVVHLRNAATGADRALRLTAGSAADFLPAVSGTRVAYATLARGGRHATIVVRSLTRGSVAAVYTGPADRYVNPGVDVARGPAAVALAAGQVAFEWSTVENAGTGFGLPAFGVVLYAASGGRVVRLDTRGGATDGACSGYTNLASLSIAGGYAVAEVTSPVGWELERAAVRQPAAVVEGRSSAAIGYANGAYYGPDGQADYLPSVAVDGSRIVFTGPASPGETLGESPLDPFTSHDKLLNPDQC